MNDRGFLILKIFNPLVFKNDSALIHSYLITGIKKHKNGENKDIIKKHKLHPKLEEYQLSTNRMKNVLQLSRY